MAYKQLNSGDTAPMFIEKTLSSDAYSFDTVGGRYILLGFFGSLENKIGQEMWRFILNQRALFNDEFLAFFGITSNLADKDTLKEFYPGIRHFLDNNAQIARAYGSFDIDPMKISGAYRTQWVLLDPMMRVYKVIEVREGNSDQNHLIELLKSLPTINKQVGFEIMAPVLVLPRIFEPDFCQDLINLYEQNGGEISGFMRQVEGKTVGIHDLSHKSRTDFNIEDEFLKKRLQRIISAKIIPQIEKAYQYKATRMERYLVACYDAETGGHFRAHRDNTTSGTAHRRFAISINLNDAFEGGEVGFAEYGSRTFKPPPGGAVVFSCSLLHHVTKVTSGKRYAFLPFLYDEQAALIREQNNINLAEDVKKYQNAS